jgi:hypothetical protein
VLSDDVVAPMLKSLDDLELQGIGVLPARCVGRSASTRCVVPTTGPAPESATAAATRSRGRCARLERRLPTTIRQCGRRPRRSTGSRRTSRPCPGTTTNTTCRISRVTSSSGRVRWCYSRSSRTGSSAERGAGEPAAARAASSCLSPTSPARNAESHLRARVTASRAASATSSRTTCDGSGLARV